jgi:predicted ArsR family transcriptional regulator
MKTSDAGASFDERVGRVAALGEPVRRALYRYVIGQRDPVDREQAAAAVGVAQHAAKFHLDRLTADGLLDADYSRPAGRGGPGAGRPAKRYRRSGREVAVSLPERRYDLAGAVMARAIDAATASGSPVADAMRDAAMAEGRMLGEQASSAPGATRGAAACRRAVCDVLTEYGYEPHAEGDRITLANCPFHRLAHDHRELVCGMNLNLMSGLLGVCERSGLQARLEPEPGRCCVTLARQRGGRREARAVGR